MTEENQTSGQGEQNQDQDQMFNIQKVYTKDISFESPNAPDVFKGEDWDPDLDVQLSSRSRPLSSDVFEVVLTVTVTAKLDNDRSAYLAEVQQAGVFRMHGFEREKIQYMVGSFCPNILFPFAREALADLVTRGGFPQMILNPVNFDLLYQQQIQQGQGQSQATEQQH